MTTQLQTLASYADLLAEIKTRVRAAHMRAAFAVSRELILLCWSIGRDILNRQQFRTPSPKKILSSPSRESERFKVCRKNGDTGA